LLDFFITMEAAALHLLINQMGRTCNTMSDLYELSVIFVYKVLL
jgi:hypothetical protein